MENNQEKYEKLSVSESDTSTVLLDISKLEYKLKKLEALANAPTSDIESDNEFDFSDIYDDENLDLDNDSIIPSRTNKNYQNEDFKSRRYSRFIGYATPSHESSETSSQSKNVLKGKLI